jgi:cell division protein FtsQ
MPRVKPSRPAMPARIGAVPMQDRPGRWKLLLRRQRRLLKPAVAVGAVILVLGGAALAIQAGTGETFRDRVGHAGATLGLRVREVVVEGRQKTPDGLLRAAIGVAPGDPILTYSVAAARARIETLTWVQSATVERRLPGTIVVQVVERRPFAVWQMNGRFVLIDRAGELVTDSDVAAFAGQLPLLVGAGAPQAAAGLLDALANQPALMSRMVAAVRVGQRRWNLRMNNGADVKLPEGAEVLALARLAELQADHALLDRPLQVIDLRLPDRMVLRPQPDRNTADKPNAAPETHPAVRKPT